MYCVCFQIQARDSRTGQLQQLQEKKHVATVSPRPRHAPTRATWIWPVLLNYRSRSRKQCSYFVEPTNRRLRQPVNKVVVKCATPVAASLMPTRRSYLGNSRQPSNLGIFGNNRSVDLKETPHIANSLQREFWLGRVEWPLISEDRHLPSLVSFSTIFS